MASRSAASAAVRALLRRQMNDTGGQIDRQIDGQDAQYAASLLACEIASRALRVNAVAVSADVDPVALQALLRHVAGARSQFLTGQTLRTMR